MKELQFILKVGGSLGHGQGLPALTAMISRLGRDHPVLVVPGGGKSADLVRNYHRRFRISDTAAHFMAILAMDQYGYLLADLIAHSLLVRELETARETALGGMVPVLLPMKLMRQIDPLPHTWEVTSDSIAAWVGIRIGVSRLVLLKDVDGLFSRDPASGQPVRLLTEVARDDLAALKGGVDPYLPWLLTGTGLEVWVINGQHPERLLELLESGFTLGTHIKAL